MADIHDNSSFESHSGRLKRASGALKGVCLPDLGQIAVGWFGPSPCDFADTMPLLMCLPLRAAQTRLHVPLEGIGLGLYMRVEPRKEKRQARCRAAGMVWFCVTLQTPYAGGRKQTLWLRRPNRRPATAMIHVQYDALLPGGDVLKPTGTVRQVMQLRYLWDRHEITQ